MAIPQKKCRGRVIWETDYAKNGSTKKGKWEGDASPKHSKPYAQGFNRSNTKSHLAHAKEMGLNERQYVKAAADFFNSKEGKIYFDNRRNCYVKIDENKLLVCACDSEGTIKTFYKTTASKIKKIKIQDKLEIV